MHGSLEAWCAEALSSASASEENEASCVDKDKLLEELFNSQTSACPHVVSLQRSIDEGTLWGDAAHYGYSDDGRKRYQSGRVYTAAKKLEELIVETHARRVRLCKATRPTSCGRRRSPSQGQAQECVLLEATAWSSGNAS